MQGLLVLLCLREGAHAAAQPDRLGSTYSRRDSPLLVRTQSSLHVSLRSTTKGKQATPNSGHEAEERLECWGQRVSFRVVVRRRPRTALVVAKPVAVDPKLVGKPVPSCNLYCGATLLLLLLLLLLPLLLLLVLLLHSYYY